MGYPARAIISKSFMGNKARANKFLQLKKLRHLKHRRLLRVANYPEMNKIAPFLSKNKEENEVVFEEIKSLSSVSCFTSQRLFNDITMENYLAVKFVQKEFSVSTFFYAYLLAEQFYHIFWIVIIIISYIALFIMSTSTNNTKGSETGAVERKPRLRLWNPKPTDDNDKDIQAPQVVHEEPMNDDIYLPEDRPLVNIINSIKHEDLPECRPSSECHDIHPADPNAYDMKDHAQNYRHRIFHEEWTAHEVKVFTHKYVNLQSNKEKKFELMAKALPGKTSSDCRQFYYLYKHILDFKTPERERKQIEKERKESLLRLKEPCSSRLRSRRKQEPHATSRGSDTPNKKYSVVTSTQTNRPVFVRKGSKPQERSTELIKDLQTTEESIASPVSTPFTAPLHENELPNLPNLLNLNLLADVCSTKPEIQIVSKSTPKAEQNQQKNVERKRSCSEAKIDEKSSAKKDYPKTSKKRCRLDNNGKSVKSAAKVVKVQEIPTSKASHGRKRKRQENVVDGMVVGEKKTRTGRAVKPPTKMDL